MHWMDEASASLLRRVAQDVRAGPWVIAVTRRDQDTGFVADGLEDATVVRPTPLAGVDAESLLQTATEAAPMLPDEIATLIDRSGGNPLFLLELLGAARAAGGVDGLPTSVEGIVTAQIDRLPARRPPSAAVRLGSGHELHRRPDAGGSGRGAGRPWTRPRGSAWESSWRRPSRVCTGSATA